MTTGRKACRGGAPCQPHSVGEAAYCLIHHSEIDARRLAELLGVRYGYLLDAANPDREEVQLQTRLIVPLTMQTGNPVLVEFIARAVGGTFLLLPDSADTLPDVVTQIGAVASAFGEVLTRVADVTAAHRRAGDNGLTLNEIRNIGCACDAAVREVTRLKAMLGNGGRVDEESVSRVG